ncbi:MAG: FAD:protein FMN transferase [Balneolales bacterium]
MGTRFHLILPDLDDDTAEFVFIKVQNEVNRIESKISRFLPDSEISLLNRTAFSKPVCVSTEVYEALKVCHHYFDLTQGAFNISIRPLLQFWANNTNNSEHLSDPADLLNKLNKKCINFDDANQTISFDNEHVEIDLGGFGKGYALGKIDTILDDYSIENAFISFGESSILTRGCQPGGDYWKIGVKDYKNPNQALHTFSINEGSVSTSSNFFVGDDGKLRNHRHVINPFTGYPVEDIITLSVSAESPVTAEILSTAFLVLPENEVRSITKNMKNVTAVKVNYSTGNYEAAIL